MGARKLPQFLIDHARYRLGAALRLAATIERRATALGKLFPSVLAYARGCPSDPDALKELLGDPQIAALLLPDPARRLKLAEVDGRASRTIIYSSDTGEGVLAWRDRKAILVEVRPDSVCAWSSVVSTTGIGLGKHHKHIGGGQPNASRYGSDVDPVKLELAVFAGGFGHFAGPSRIFMYGGFQSDIGTVQNYPTKFLKVQLDRVKRPKREHEGKKTSQGYFVLCHGYPILLKELRADFAAGAKSVEEFKLAT